jgi:hypothetical protein
MLIAADVKSQFQLSGSVFLQVSAVNFGLCQKNLLTN